jgi:hypothetical protein
VAGCKSRELAPELEQVKSHHAGSVDDSTGPSGSTNFRAIVVMSFGRFLDHVPDDVV